MLTGHDGVLHQQDGVFGRHPHQHDETYHGWHRQGGMGDKQRQYGAGYREDQGCQNRHRLHEILEQQHQYQIDTEDAGRHGEAESFEQFGHRFGIAQGGLADASGQLLQAG